LRIRPTDPAYKEENMRISVLTNFFEKIFSKIKLKYVFTIAAVAVLTGAAGTETIQMHSWYPSPYGSYQKMKITNMLHVGETAKPGTLNLYGTAVVTNDTFVATDAGSQLTVGTTDKAAAISGRSFSANILGNLQTNDAYFRGLGKWASELGGSTYVTGISAQPPARKSTASGTMILPAGKTYTVMLWAYYYTCEDYTTNLLLDGTVMRSYYGAGNDTAGCDQNSIFHVQTGVGSGTHTWSTNRGGQQTFMWLAYPEN
jgi:hypothetical protein